MNAAAPQRLPNDARTESGARGSYAVAQIGVRTHYAVPRILHRAGRLERMYTDICATKGWPRLLGVVPPSLRPAGLRRLLGRMPHGVPPERITAFTRFGWDYYRARAAAPDESKRGMAYLTAAKTFGALVARCGFGAAAGVYVFNGAGLEVMRAAREQGMFRVVEQTIAPSVIHAELMSQEQAAFPDWEPRLDERHVAAFCEREWAEWRLADRILCGSEFVRQGIEKLGGPAAGCVVVPYGLELPYRVPQRRQHSGPLHVLTVGTIGLRKGVQYVLAAARVSGAAAKFRMVGPVVISDAARRELQTCTEVWGGVPRTDMAQHYEWADVFLLPSLCEGSATVTYEALAFGLAVICTPNTGSIVRDGVDGFIVPVRSPQAIAEKLELLRSDPALLAAMSENARSRVGDISLEAYGTRLLAALTP